MLLFSSCDFAGQLYEQFPEKIDQNAKYVFYSHGLIVEGDNPTPVSNRWGKYDFPKVKSALTDDGYHLIAYHRAKNTKAKIFAKKLKHDINLLITKGVKSENITLLGFSRGGEISILTSHYLKSKKVRLALLASCPNFMENHPDYQVYGEVYSIYETSDRVGSCQFLIAQSKNVDRFEEIAITTGEEHGAFFRPIPEWLDPLKSWLNKNN
jgi:hypothetical protein